MVSAFFQQLSCVRPLDRWPYDSLGLSLLVHKTATLAQSILLLATVFQIGEVEVSPLTGLCSFTVEENPKNPWSEFSLCLIIQKWLTWSPVAHGRGTEPS